MKTIKDKFINRKNDELIQNLQLQIQSMSREITDLKESICSTSTDFQTQNIKAVSAYISKLYSNERSKLNITMYGDSLTLGIDQSKPKNRAIVNDDCEKEYIYRKADITIGETIEQLLNHMYPHTTKVSVCAINGSTVKDGCLQWTNPNNADVVTIGYGTNDSKNIESIVEFIDYYERFVQRWINNGSAVVLMLPPSRRVKSINPQLISVRAAIEQIAVKYACPTIDLSVCTSNFDSSAYSDATHYTSDANEAVAWYIVSHLMGDALVRKTNVGHNLFLQHPSQISNISRNGRVIKGEYPTLKQYESLSTALKLRAGNKVYLSINAIDEGLVVMPRLSANGASGDIAIRSLPHKFAENFAYTKCKVHVNQGGQVDLTNDGCKLHRSGQHLIEIVNNSDSFILFYGLYFEYSK